MPIFLSHKKVDSQYANALYRRFTNEGIDCYLDELDPETQTTNDITTTIVKKIHETSHILAVVSSNTEKSWWVPFEIGVATEINRYISTYSITSNIKSLPEYLSKWPIITSTTELNNYIEKYKSQKQSLMEKRSSFSDIKYPIQKYESESFHESLKRSFGQI